MATSWMLIAIFTRFTATGQTTADDPVFVRAGTVLTLRTPEARLSAGLMFRVDQRLLDIYVLSGHEPEPSHEFDVRVPEVSRLTRLELVDAAKPDKLLKELFVYPKNWMATEGIPTSREAPVRRLASGAPSWLLAWMQAVGLEHERQARLSLDEGSEPPTVTIAGLSRETGDDVARILDQARNGRWVVGLVACDAGRSADLSPNGLAGPLAGLGEERWQNPLKVLFAIPPDPIVSNRLPIARSVEGWPLIESYYRGNACAVVSRIDWPRILGRDSRADRLLIDLLSRQPDKRPEPGTKILILRTRDRKVQDPVLARIEDRVDNWNSADAVLLDARGFAEYDYDAIKRYLSAPVYSHVSILLLGRDEGLESALRLDSPESHGRRPLQKGQGRVAWLPDDQYPPDVRQRIELMWMLTRMGIQLTHAVQATQGD